MTTQIHVLLTTSTIITDTFFFICRPTTPGSTAEMLRVSVTCSEAEYKKDTTFKVVTKVE